MAASHSVPPPATHGTSAASAAIQTSGHLSDREAAADAQRKALFDFVSPYDALQGGQPSQLYGVHPTASQSQGPPLAKKKPGVPYY